MLGIANYFCLFICCSLVASSVLVVLTTRGTDICTGKYLATKWDFEQLRPELCDRQSYTQYGPYKKQLFSVHAHIIYI